MTVSMQEWLQAARDRRAEITRQIGEMNQLHHRHTGERQKLGEERAQVLADLAQAILPDLTPEALGRAVQLTGFVALTGDDPVGRREAERRQLTTRLAEIEADPRFANRELLRAPRIGQLTRQVDELQEFRAPLAETVARAGHPRLEHLIRVGYGSPAYGVAFWRLSYYRDWEAGDQILERFPGKASFAEVRDEYVQAAETIQVYDQKLAELRAEIDAGEKLEEEHTAAAQALATLDPRHLEAWRARLAEHLGSADARSLADRLGGVPDYVLMLQRADGIGKKIEYLDGIVDARVQPVLAELRAEDEKLAADLQKNSNPKKAGLEFDEAAVRKRFHDRPAKLRQRMSDAEGSYRTVAVFDSYERGSFLESFLWWDLMTDGRIDGDFIPEVGRRHHEDAMSTAAAAVAETDRSETPARFDAS